MWPRFLNYSEKKCRGETKQNPAVQCFQRAHHLPAWRQIEIRVAVTRLGILANRESRTCWPDDSNSVKGIVRQQWNFTPPESIRGVEEYQVELLSGGGDGTRTRDLLRDRQAF